MDVRAPKLSTSKPSNPSSSHATTTMSAATLLLVTTAYVLNPARPPRVATRDAGAASAVRMWADWGDVHAGTLADELMLTPGLVRPADSALGSLAPTAGAAFAVEQDDESTHFIGLHQHLSPRVILASGVYTADVARE